MPESVAVTGGPTFSPAAVFSATSRSVLGPSANTGGWFEGGRGGLATGTAVTVMVTSMVASEASDGM